MRYVIANRRAGKYTSDAKISSRVAMMSAFGLLETAKILAEQAPEDPTTRQIILFDAESSELEAKRAHFPLDAIVEPEILFYPASGWLTHTRPSDFPVSATVPPSG